MIRMYLYAKTILCKSVSSAQDAVGIDVQLLDEVHGAIAALYQPLPAGSGAPAMQVEARQVFAQAVEASLYKATNQLLDDLHGNCSLLGTPERCPP